MHAADAPGALVATNRSGHGPGAHDASESGVPIDVFVADGDVLVVESACAGCLLDVSLKTYVGTEAVDAIDMDVPMVISADATDSAVLSLAGLGSEPFGLIVQATVVDEQTGKARDESLTFFGVVDEKGALATLTWTEFICARCFARCFDDAAGQWIVDLGLAIPTDDDVEEAFIVGGE